MSCQHHGAAAALAEVEECECEHEQHAPCRSGATGFRAADFFTPHMHEE